MFENMTLPEVLFILLLLATLLNRVVEYSFGTLFDKIEKLQPHTWALMYIAAGLGIWAAFTFDMDMLMAFGFPLTKFGMVITGVVISGGANLINDVWPNSKPDDPSLVPPSA